jgi:hypothetical protein
MGQHLHLVLLACGCAWLKSKGRSATGSILSWLHLLLQLHCSGWVSMSFRYPSLQIFNLRIGSGRVVGFSSPSCGPSWSVNKEKRSKRKHKEANCEFELFCSINPSSLIDKKMSDLRWQILKKGNRGKQQVLSIPGQCGWRQFSYSRTNPIGFQFIIIV